ncbi:MAG: hypothetical protein FJX64_10570 [Alphaproteobacteria bacterium]|nr:hypothetical protein [Alphaproteobacteria bacterium]
MTDTKEDRIGFPQLVENALRGVVREALRKVARDGLPGAHHFYITCRSQDPGVELPAYLREKFPEEITLVLQHQFWDLAVWDESFSVTLSFSGKSEHLRIPFTAISSFVDPSLEFVLQFKPLMAAAGPAPVELPQPAAKLAEAKVGAKDDEKEAGSDEPKVVKLDSFRRG